MEEPKKTQEEYAFLQERIKPSRWSAKRWLNYVAMVGILGIVFGACAGVGIALVKPTMESVVMEEERVQIPEDVEPEVTPESGITVPPVLTEEVELEVQDMEEMNVRLTDIAKEVYPSLFAVYCREEGVLRQAALDPNDGEVALNETTGLLVAKTSNEFLILTSTQSLITEEKIYVESYGGYEYSATVKKKDENLGYAILSVRCANVTDEELVVADLGNSNAVSQGDMVMVVGNQFGYDKGIAYGMISSAEHTLNQVDGEYRLLATDIPSVENGTGVMLNTAGEVVGLVNENILKHLGGAPISAIGISNMKATIELLSNGKPVPYMGITGMGIAEEVAEQYQMPVGYYVQKVAQDSPAMVAGIRNGDIIIKMDEADIASSLMYRAKLLGYKVEQNVAVVVARLGQGEYVEVECTVAISSME